MNSNPSTRATWATTGTRTRTVRLSLLVLVLAAATPTPSRAQGVILEKRFKKKGGALAQFLILVIFSPPLTAGCGPIFSFVTPY